MESYKFTGYEIPFAIQSSSFYVCDRPDALRQGKNDFILVNRLPFQMVEYQF
jgi:hypothetical protein